MTSHLLIAPLLLVLLCFAVALYLLAIGLRGRRTGVAPHCRNCRFDLSGTLPETWTPTNNARCPECGTLLADRRDVTRGLHRRRPLPIAFATLLLLPALASVMLFVAGFDWIRLKPTWILIAESRSSDAWKAGSAAEELASRLSADRLSDAHLVKLLDAYLTHAEAQTPRSGQDAWPSLAQAAFDKGLAMPADRDRYLKAILSGFARTHPRLQDRYLIGQRFPADEEDRIIRPEPTSLQWLIPGQEVGMAVYLQEATLDGAPLELRDTWHGKAFDSAREGWVGAWRSFGTHGSPPWDTLFPEPVREVVRITPPAGAHEATFRWRIDAFLLNPQEAETYRLDHPFREADASWEASLNHTFKVLASTEELVPLVRSSGPNAQPPPLYRGPDEGLVLKVVEAKKLRRDGDWYFFIAGALDRKPPSLEVNYAVLASIHLEVDGVPYHVAEWQRVSDVFYDRTTAAPVGPSSSSRPRTSFRLNIIDLPRVDRVDIVLTPTPEWVLRSPDEYPVEPYWGEPVIIRDVPIDWSAVMPQIEETESNGG